ncbi:TlyA family RNA methyltransferase [Microlunatus elymi]|uniref:TlyA family RNA methyltransferase n=1 Tax=Microlunatus elymi TaxID=2596828 RepID=A0A516Q1J7_9ACTN|nr:TlyA family RNA methyltransferase [Microlunatus elymi]QDP97305.1 TlyA family RNA methyltransferase [Microlunatus elymi]
MISRLDVELAARGLARSRSHARELIDQRLVLVNGSVAGKASQQIAEHDQLELTEHDPYVSRAAYKLIGALDDLGLSVPARVLDAGASTGGFTQVLLERGSAEVIAIDVGHDQLHPLLRQDPRVIPYEGHNLRDLDLDLLDRRPVELVVADVSFISLTLLLGPLTSVIGSGGRLLTMIKPQFEVGRERLGKGGVVRTDALRRAGVQAVVEAAATIGWHPQAAARSRLPGPAGNVEYFVCFASRPPAPGVIDGLFDQDPAGR